MTNICFFNFYHNGDLFHSKPFVREVVKTFGKEKVMYAHYKSHDVFQEFDIPLVRLEGIDHKTKVLRTEEPDMLFLNTWIGSYFDKYEGECTLNFNMKMWADIYEEINKVFGTDLKLGLTENYLPYVNYSKYDLSYVKAYLDGDANPKILLCNGPAFSGQSQYVGDMGEFIRPLAIHHPDKTFIITSGIVNEDKLPNIVTTDSITQRYKRNGCDLNEISYLSKFCSLIVGQNSGPFCFSSTEENLNDPNKIFYAFGSRETDCFTHGYPVKCNYIFEKYVDVDQLYESIKKLVNNL